VGYFYSRYAGNGPPEDKEETCGHSPGKEGLQEAINYVYSTLYPSARFDRNRFKKIEDTLYRATQEGTEGKTIGITFPIRSIIQDVYPSINFQTDTLQNYVSDLWNLCWKTDPSTFGALYLFTTVWYIDVGNDHGCHITPFVPRSDPDAPKYYTGRLIKWRHTWHIAMICQLVIMAPTVFSQFIGLFTAAL
jgi:hypothetical protein